MAHFAKLDPNNLVTDIVFIDNAVTADVYLDGNDGDKEKSIEVEQNGIDYLQSIFGSDTIWKQCSFNTWKNKHKLGGTPLRYNMAEIGYRYDSLRDAFIPPKPGNGYILVERTLQWTSTADFSNNYINRLSTYSKQRFIL
tara:strand:- start:443 stop:862 length:420 start_codon:yes stop_codon:yes gene_type:complete